MKIQYCSDLHLEFPANNRLLRKEPIIPVGEILVLAGDIIPFQLQNKYSHFFDYVSDHFETVYWVPGNHEYYGFDIAMKDITLHEQVRRNVFLLNNKSILHSGVKLIFSTLWSYIRPANEWEVQQNISDFSQIKNNKKKFNVQDFNLQHFAALDFLTNELKDHDMPTVVITHHVPTLMNYPEKYKCSPLSDAFATELFPFIENSHADCWIYGHNHYNVQPFSIGNTRLLTNQIGYVQMNEHTAFERNACIEL